MQKVWDWFKNKSESKHARFWLWLLSFSESSFFIIPPDVLLIAMLSAGAKNWKRLSAITSLGSILGAVFGYFIGAFLFNSFAEHIISFYGLVDEFNKVGELYTHGAFFVILVAAFTPIPFKVFVISGGFFNIPFISFMFASTLGRSARFFLVGWISKKYGPFVAESFVKNFKIITYISVLLFAFIFIVYYMIQF